MDGHSALNFEELFAMPQPNMTEVVSSSGSVVVTGRPLPVTPAMRETLEFIQSTTPVVFVADRTVETPDNTTAGIPENEVKTLVIKI